MTNSNDVAAYVDIIFHHMNRHGLWHNLKGDLNLAGPISFGQNLTQYVVSIMHYPNPTNFGPTKKYLQSVKHYIFYAAISMYLQNSSLQNHV